MTKITRSSIARVTEAVLEAGFKMATVYLAPDLIVRCTATHKPDRRYRQTTVVLTAGKPNFRECKFIAACKKAGEPFPVRKMQLKHWPKH